MSLDPRRLQLLLDRKDPSDAYWRNALSFLKGHSLIRIKNLLNAPHWSKDERRALCAFQSSGIGTPSPEEWFSKTTQEQANFIIDRFNRTNAASCWKDAWLEADDATRAKNLGGSTLHPAWIDDYVSWVPTSEEGNLFHVHLGLVVLGEPVWKISEELRLFHEVHKNIRGLHQYGRIPHSTAAIPIWSLAANYPQLIEDSPGIHPWFNSLLAIQGTYASRVIVDANGTRRYPATPYLNPGNPLDLDMARVLRARRLNVPIKSSPCVEVQNLTALMDSLSVEPLNFIWSLPDPTQRSVNSLPVLDM